MHRYTPIHCLILSAAITLLASLFVFSAQAADIPTKAPAPAAVTAGDNAVAAGSIEDSLKACLARIPSDATTGQRMIAEQGCQRDEAERRAIQAVPGR